MQFSPKNIAVAVSGGGRSLENLILKQKDQRYRVTAVISSNTNCRGCDIAKEHGIDLLCLDFSKENFEATEVQLYKWLEPKKIEIIALAGFLKKFPLRSSWENKIINIHPALLPKFGGKGMYGNNVHKAVISKNEKESGATIHYVNKVYDQGKIIARTVVKIDQNDDYKKLADKVFEAECKLYPEVIDNLLNETLPLEGESIKEYKV